MTPESLLKPRYKVISLFPLCDLKIGDVISFEVPNVSIASYSALNGDRIKYAVPEETIKAYPHLFKPLAWWEERKPEEMPEYVKLVMNEKISFVHKVEKWAGYNAYGVPMYDYMNRVGYIVSGSVTELLPATLAEYEADQKAYY